MMERRRWLLLAKIGVGLAIVAMVFVVLVLVDKAHFGWMVGTWFAPIISAGVMVGSLILLVSAWMLPERKSWRGIVLLVWALIGLTSPAFGYLFLAPWILLLLSLPVVIWILVTAK